MRGRSGRGGLVRREKIRTPDENDAAIGGEGTRLSDVNRTLAALRAEGPR
jgi:hypothetical protein